ncbi:lycopene cyclase [Desertihabitans brevis]|uniref:Lycopene cyclase n=1 Tax=Desertihabitans brevis TaxID=2268447 RepID=A0A367YXB7_9ACTN|nr:lycopene cyclase [Desertihabitans brevis]
MLVLGLGPAGRALTHRLAAAGVEVVAVDPAPERPWTPTYAAWADELPGWLAPEAVSTRFEPWVHTGTARRVPREYVVLSTPRLQRSLTLDGAQLLTGTVAEADATRVLLRDGTRLTASCVLDARGAPLDPARAQQTAVGVVVSRRRAEEVLGGPWLMDWRRHDHATAGQSASEGPANFLYALPLDADDALLEETCLVGRPALGMRELRERLETRLAGHGLTLSGYERTEHVRFAVEPDPAAGRRPGPVPFGARGGLMHPGTGYSVAVSLRLADVVVAAVRAGRDPRRALWTPAAQATRRLRQAGLRTLLGLDAAGTVRFFDAFFALPVSLQRSYLSAWDDPRGTLAAMVAMAGRLPPRLTSVAVRSTAAEVVAPVGRRLRPPPRRAG